MKEFIFYTFEGYTESPTGKVLENLQILGFEKGKNENEAFTALINNNQWIIKSGFNKDKIISKQLAI
ncbi:MAG: hypothetical protein IJF39_01330 [Clostridia bacterium]|jgi:hypothetical protein|nr:hypothetical protein [Clostridia bacterium]